MRSNFFPFIAIVNFLAVSKYQAYGVKDTNEMKEHHVHNTDAEPGESGVVPVEQNTNDEINDVKKTGNLRRRDQEEFYVPPDITSEMKEMLALINEERKRYDAPELCFNEKLVIAALRHNNDLRRKYQSGGISLERGSTGSTLNDRVGSMGYKYWALGQNADFTYTGQSVQELYTKMMQSSAQRRNILNPDFDQIGIGIGTTIRNGHRGELLYTTQIFGAGKSGEKCILDPDCGLPPLPDLCDDKEVWETSGDQHRRTGNKRYWYDAGGFKYNCEWYASDPEKNCARYGNKYSNFGMTANDACCVCGGGDQRYI